MAQQHANEDLSAYLDGELTDAEIAEFEAELARDPELRAELHAFEGVVQWLREEGPDAAPMGFHHGVMARVDTEHPERTSIWAWLRRPLGFPLEGWLVGAAAAAVLLIVLNPGPSGSPISTDAWTDPPTDGTSPAAVKLPDPVSTEGLGTKVAKPGPVAPGPVAPTPTGPTTKEAAPVPAPAPTPSTTTAGPQGTADEEDATAEPLGSPGYSYVVRSSDPELKLNLLRLAGRYGGAVGPRGTEVTDAAMTASSEALLVQVPQPDLTRFAAELEALGYEIVRSPSTEIVRGATIPVHITLQLVGGAIDAAPTGVNSARKGRNEEAMDVIERE